MTPAVALLTFVTLQRGAELLWARRNTARLVARGAVETGASHYPFIVAAHATWLAGLWALAWNAPVNPLWFSIFMALQAGRVWVLATLGERWTTRIVVLPGAPLARGGPYRFLSHPNYVVVAGEVFALPMAFGLVAFALAFSVLNAALMVVRVRAEEKALGR